MHRFYLFIALFCFVSVASADDLNSTNFTYECRIQNTLEKDAGECRITGAICNKPAGSSEPRHPGAPVHSGCKTSTIHVECPEMTFLHIFAARHSMDTDALRIAGRSSDEGDSRSAQLQINSFEGSLGVYDSELSVLAAENEDRLRYGECRVNAMT